MWMAPKLRVAMFWVKTPERLKQHDWVIKLYILVTTWDGHPSDWPNLNQQTLWWLINRENVQQHYLVYSISFWGVQGVLFFSPISHLQQFRSWISRYHHICNMCKKVSKKKQDSLICKAHLHPFTRLCWHDLLKHSRGFAGSRPSKPPPTYFRIAPMGQAGPPSVLRA